MKKAIAMCLMLVVVVAGAFATRIGITYNGVEYILNTSRAISADNQQYFSGMYDGFACVQQGYNLAEIHLVVNTKTFPDTEDAAAARQEYEEAFLDFMTNYSYGTEGNFEDIWPIYKQLMASTISFENAKEIVYYGSARFYPKNI